MGALDGLTVVELGGGVAPAYATKLLADLGAAVGKVGPGRPDGLGAYLDAGKTLLDEPVDADIVVEDLGPGGLEAIGLVPTGAVVRISPFGQAGPRADQPATELTVQASGGWVSNHGIPGLDPVRTGGRAPAYVAGGYAAAAALTAQRTAVGDGRGGGRRPLDPGLPDRDPAVPDALPVHPRHRWASGSASAATSSPGSSPAPTATSASTA